MSLITYVTEGSRIFCTSWKNCFFPKKHTGTAEEICRKVVDTCWNGRFFQTSTTNFPQFWTRDFGWCTASLLELGYKDKVHQTLRYALNRFIKHRSITTTISPSGKPYDFPTMAVDSLPWLIHSIRISNFSHHTYRLFLNKEINRFYRRVIDPKTGLVRSDKHFSSMKDFAIRKSSCYDNCMVGMLAHDLTKMKLANPFRQINYPELIVKHFWQGTYFSDDLTAREYIAGDANLFPFLTGMVQDKKKAQQMLDSIDAAGLDYPLPLKYTASRADVKFIWQEFFLRNYESNSVWLHMGPLFAKVVKQIDPVKAAQYKKKYEEVIKRLGTFPEVLTAEGKPFRTPFYYCDSGMLWAVNYLTL